MLTVIGGLAVMLGSSPLAAQTAASAVRSVPSAVAPSETFTVTISAWLIYGTWRGFLTDDATCRISLIRRIATAW